MARAPDSLDTITGNIWRSLALGSELRFTVAMMKIDPPGGSFEKRLIDEAFAFAQILIEMQGNDSSIASILRRYAKAFLDDQPIDPGAEKAISGQLIGLYFYHEIIEGDHEDESTHIENFLEGGLVAARIIAASRERARQLLDAQKKKRGRPSWFDEPDGFVIAGFLAAIMLAMEAMGSQVTLPANELADEEAGATELVKVCENALEITAKKIIPLLKQRGIHGMAECKKAIARINSLRGRPLVDRLRKLRHEIDSTGAN